MVKLFADTTEKRDNFFDDDYVADSGATLKIEAKKFEGEANFHNGETKLEGKWSEKGKIQDHKVKTEFTVRSNSEHEIESEWDLKKVIDKTEFLHKTEWNSSTHDHSHTLSLKNESIKKMTNQFDFAINKDKEWSITHHWAKKKCSSLQIKGDYTWDGKSSAVTSSHWGILFNPSKFGSVFLTYSTDGAIDKKTNWKHFGTLAWRQRLKIDGTKLGFDWGYNLAYRTSNLTLGIATKPADNLKFKGKVNSDGEIEASAKLEIAKDWEVTVGSALKGGAFTGPQQSIFGISLEGELK